MTKIKKTTANLRKNINYPIGDFLIRLKNAVIGNNKEVVVPNTKLIKAVSGVLKKEGFLDNIVSSDNGDLVVNLAYRRKEPILMDIKLVSKPGLRVYAKIDELESKKGPFIMILSTPLGIMTGKDAIKKRTGGEIIAKIY